MKTKFLKLQSLLAAALSVVFAFSFASCSSDDDGPNDNDLGKVVVGTWAQDGDNDILTIKADGTGVGYDNPTAFQNNQVGYSFRWSYENGWVTVSVNGQLVEKMRAKSVSQNKIEWQRYAIETDDYDPSDDEWDGHDAFGYYDLWTWERYK